MLIFAHQLFGLFRDDQHSDADGDEDDAEDEEEGHDVAGSQNRMKSLQSLLAEGAIWNKKSKTIATLATTESNRFKPPRK